MADLGSGSYDAALVIGVELEKTVPGDTAAAHLGPAGWTGHEGSDAHLRQMTVGGAGLVLVNGSSVVAGANGS